MAKVSCAPAATLCPAHVPGGPLDFEGDWELVLCAPCPSWGIFNSVWLQDDEQGQVQGEPWCDPERWVRLCGQRGGCMLSRRGRATVRRWLVAKAWNSAPSDLSV